MISLLEEMQRLEKFEAENWGMTPAYTKDRNSF